MRIKSLPYRLTVAKYDHIPEPLSGFYSLSSVGGEISLVCETEKVPQGTLAREDGWCALMVEGPLDFSLVGILADLSSALADAGIPIFALSTYDTDYIMVKADRLQEGCAALESKGYLIRI